MYAKKAAAESTIEEGQKNSVQFLHVYVFVLYTAQAKIRHPDLSFNLLINQLIFYSVCSRNKSWEGIWGKI